MTGTAIQGKGLGRFLKVHSLVVYGFFYLPILLLVVFSFSASRNLGVWGGPTFEWYKEFAQTKAVKDSLIASLQIAVVSTAISVVLGTMAALALERFMFKGKELFDAVLYLPIIIPDVTMAAMMLLFFAQLGNLLGLEKGFATIVLSHVAFNISFVSVVVRARLAGMDDRLEEAAFDLYAGPWRAFRHVTLPQIMPGVLGGALLAFTLSMDEVVITQFVAGPGWTTLPVYVFGLIRKGVTPMINAVSVVILVLSMTLVGLSILAEQRRSNKA